MVGTTSYDWIVVGAGLSGATLAERIASQLGQTVLVVDKRPHIAGNAHDPVIEGVRVHRYGAHLFHTSSERVWRYLSTFTAWRPHTHRVRGVVDGRVVPLPVNLDTLSSLLGRDEGRRFGHRLIDRYGEGTKLPMLRLLEDADDELAALGRVVYEKIYLSYTIKQWGRSPDELDPSVTGRVPLVLSHDDRYFRDAYQALPADGYDALVTRMLDHPDITVAVSTPIADLGTSVRSRHMVFTGPLDELCDYEYGALPYRTLSFDDRWHQCGPRQEVAVVNHPAAASYTRVIEHAHFSAGHEFEPTVLTYEHPGEHIPGVTEPYYPLPVREAHALYRRYEALAATVHPRTVLAGRLARYRYLDMDQAVNLALQTFTSRVVPMALGQEVPC